MQHTQAILIRYLSATDTKGSRVKLIDKRFKTSITLGTDYKHNNPLAQAKEWLEGKGYQVVTNSTWSDDEWLVTVICNESVTRPPFKNIKEATECK